MVFYIIIIITLYLCINAFNVSFMECIIGLIKQCLMAFVYLAVLTCIHDN